MLSLCYYPEILCLGQKLKDGMSAWLFFFLADNRSLLYIKSRIPLSFSQNHLHETPAPNLHWSCLKTLGCPNNLSLFGIFEHKRFLRREKIMSLSGFNVQSRETSSSEIEPVVSEVLATWDSTEKSWSLPFLYLLPSSGNYPVSSHFDFNRMNHC